MRDVSIGAAISQAWERMVLVCFRPFDFGKWLTLGFCAWLAALGEGGGSFNGNSFGNNSGRGGSGDLDDVAETAMGWVADHLLIIALAAIALLLVFAAIGLLITWLKSRGDFMFVDGIVRNRGAIREPWGEYADEANSLTWLRYALGIGLSLVLLVVFAGGGVAVYFMVDGGLEPVVGIAVLVVAGLLALPVGIGVGIVQWLLSRLVMPVMYARRIGVREGFAAVRRELLPGNVGAVVLYWLARIGVGIAIGLASLVVVLVTCCIALLPYVGAVILLPASVLLRAMDLYFVEQLGQTLFRDDDDGFGEPSPYDAGPLPTTSPAPQAPPPQDPDDPWAP